MATKDRRLKSFITTFTEVTEVLGAPMIFRKWTALSLLAAACEQKVWVRSARRPLYPNMYVFIVAHPGVGKTRTINEGRFIASALTELRLAPISLTFASLVDALSQATCELIRQPAGKITYNSMYITADELGAFMPKYDNEMIDGLAAFYDPTPYRQTRRVGQIDIEIKSPQLNILAGSTPQNLMNFIPERAWGQGFMSRVMLVFSDERIITDDFADDSPPPTKDLVHDLKLISELYGQFTVTADYAAAVNKWKATGELPIPDHPKLTHYITRRRVHVYKLSMLASLNRDSALVLTEADFWTALDWIMEAETFMPDIFKAGAVNADSAAMDEIIHFIIVSNVTGNGVHEHRIMDFARQRLPINSIPRILEIMEGAGQIQCIRRDKHTGARYFIPANRGNVVPLRAAIPGGKTGPK